MRNTFALMLLGAAVTLSSPLTAQVVPQPKMGAPLNGLSVAELARFQAGRARFTQQLTVAGGLGPIFNQTACSSCHNNPVGGSGSILVTRFGSFDPKGGGFDPMEALGGSLLQSQSISPACAEVIPPGANITANRVTNSTLGMGLVEAIDDAAILARVLNPPSPLVSGAAHMVKPLESPTGPLRVGRFGWKAQVATALTFSADAALNEMGLTNRFITSENAPNGDLLLLAAHDAVNDPEDAPDAQGVEFIDRVADFQRFLAPPPQTPRSDMSGEALFIQVGCADCHTPSYTTSSSPTETALQNQAIKPYSDFLLHDMGLAADFIQQGTADMQELRTPSLWGMRVRDPMWHDGRITGGTFADRIVGPTGAIAQHNALFSEAQPAAQAFLALTTADQLKIVAFLDSLGRAEFDADGNNAINRLDALAFQAARSVTPVYGADDVEAVFDVDQDGDVDDNDFAVLVQVYEDDLNGNGTNDLRDIFVNGTSYDANGNLIPDDAETCQTNLGFQGPGAMQIAICGDSLAASGSIASAVLSGAEPFGQVFLVGSQNVALQSFPGGGVIVPGIPFLFVYPTFADASGRFATTLSGGGPAFNFILQGVQIRLGIAELSNALYVTIGQ